MTREVARTLAELSTNEIVGALGASGAPRLARAAIAWAARVPSARLGRALARFDARIADVGVAAAAREALASFGVRVEVSGRLPAASALVATNHPGAYDSLAAMAALGRDDVAFVAADRAFLRALPRLRDHLVFAGGAGGMRRALGWLERGGVLVQYGAGAIEPDARFDDADPLAEWGLGTGVLAANAARRGAAVVPMFVSGVHSARAKKLAIVRWAERRGVTTIAPLVQAALPGFRDVVVSVRIGPPLDPAAIASAATHAARAALVRDAVRALV